MLWEYPWAEHIKKSIWKKKAILIFSTREVMAEGKAPQEVPCQALSEIFQDLQQLHNQVETLGRLFPEVSH